MYIPCISMTFCDPALWWSLSMFWVTTVTFLPWSVSLLSKSATALWPALGTYNVYMYHVHVYIRDTWKIHMLEGYRGMTCMWIHMYMYVCMCMHKMHMHMYTCLWTISSKLTHITDVPHKVHITMWRPLPGVNTTSQGVWLCQPRIEAQEYNYFPIYMYLCAGYFSPMAVELPD